MPRPCAAVRVSTEERELWLVERGWWASDSGWRHKAFASPWPIVDAVQLQLESDDGRQEYAHRALRGEA